MILSVVLNVVLNASLTHPEVTQMEAVVATKILTFISEPPEGPGGMVALTESGWYNIH